MAASKSKSLTLSRVIYVLIDLSLLFNYYSMYVFLNYGHLCLITGSQRPILSVTETYCAIA